MFGDTELTLSPACYEQLEAQANFGAGRLLFFQGQLREFISLTTPSFAWVKAIKTRHGNTMTSSLRRMVEALDAPGLGLVGPLPWEAVVSDGEPCRYFIRSTKFIEQFGDVTEESRAFRCRPVQPSNLEISLAGHSRTRWVFSMSLPPANCCAAVCYYLLLLLV